MFDLYYTERRPSTYDFTAITDSRARSCDVQLGGLKSVAELAIYYKFLTSYFRTGD